MEDLCFLNVRGNQLDSDLNIWYDALFYVEQLILKEEDYHYLFDDDFETSLYEYEKENTQ